MKESKISFRIDDADLLIMDELIDLFNLSQSTIIQTILKIFLYSLCDDEGNIQQSIKNYAKEFTECNRSDSKKLSEIEEFDD